MNVMCGYRAFPGGEITIGEFNMETGTVVGIPEDIIKVKGNPTLEHFAATDQVHWRMTDLARRNIARTVGIFPQANLIIANARFQTFVLTRTSIFVYGLYENTNEYDYKLTYNDDNTPAPILFPQEYKSIGVVKTIPEYYDWYSPVSFLNVFEYNGSPHYIRNGKVLQFTESFDTKPDFSNMLVDDLARTSDDVYAVYQNNGKNKLLY